MQTRSSARGSTYAVHKRSAPAPISQARRLKRPKVAALVLPERPTSLLLSIPFEIRQQILRGLLVADEPLEYRSPPPPRSPTPEPDSFDYYLGPRRRPPPPPNPIELCLAVLGVNKQLRAEGLDLLFGENTMTMQAVAASRSRYSSDGEALLSVFNHKEGRKLDPYRSIKYLPRYKFSHVRVHIRLERDCYHHRIAGLLRRLVIVLNSAHSRHHQYKLTLIYDDAVFDDDGYCSTCQDRPSFCAYEAEEAKQKCVKEQAQKVLEPLRHLERVHSVNFIGLKPSSKPEPSWMRKGPFDLSIPTPSALIDAITSPNEDTRKIMHLCKLYNQLLEYTSALQDWNPEVFVNDIKFPHFVDKRQPQLKAVLVPNDLLEFDEERIDDERIGSFYEDGLASRCPGWLRPEMKLIRRAVLTGNKYAFYTLRDKVMGRIDLVNKASQQLAFAYG